MVKREKDAVPEVVVVEMSRTAPKGKTWVNGERAEDPGAVGLLFEQVIAEQRAAGYKLSAWQFTTCPVGKKGEVCDNVMAVFERVV